MIKLQIIMGSTRPGRKNDQVSTWVYDIARQRQDIAVELVDLADYPLPFLDEPETPSHGHYTKAHTKAWAAKIAEADGYIFVTPEYNHSTSAVLKNALDFLFAEWNDKAAGFVSYGSSANGARAIEHLRQIVGELQMADVRQQLTLSNSHDFAGGVFQPSAHHAERLNTVIDQVVAWATALKPLRHTTVRAS